MNSCVPPKMPRARLATAEELLQTIIPAYLSPPPTKRALVRLLKSAGVQTFKASPSARRGGGRVFYSVAGTERLLRQRSGMAGVGEVSR